MANNAELEEFEFRSRLEAESAAKGKPLAGNGFLQGAGNLAAGAVRGAGSIGATLLAPVDMAKDAIAGKGLSLESNRERRAKMDAGLQNMGAEPDSWMYKGGKLGSEILGTAGAGGLLAKGVGAVSQTPRAIALANALASGGFKAGSVPGIENMAIRMAGGAGAGAASAGLVDPELAPTGAVVGGMLPPAISGIAKTGDYAGRLANALVKPFTEKGQTQIAGGIVRKFGEGGPTAINASEIVAGSRPTLAEATGNAGIARLQSGARDLRPNAFVEREVANSAARNSALQGIAGDSTELAFHKIARDQAADDLYGAALSRNPEPTTAWVKGQVTQLLKRPSINEARKSAQKLAMERGEKPAAEGSLRALHDVKVALDDQISEAIRKGAGGHAKALQKTKDQLVTVMEKLSPEYGEARVTYAAMSKPINAMETLQGLNLTDATGNITLSKVQNAITNLGKMQNAPGINPAKSITSDQLNALGAIRDDLLRQSNLQAGKSAGSNTFQNIATDNIMSALLPGRFGSAINNRAGDLIGQVGKLAYSGPNEKIRAKLVEMLLDPTVAEPLMTVGGAGQLSGFRTGLNSLSDQVAPSLFRSAPVLSSSR